MKLTDVKLGQRFRFKGDWIIYRRVQLENSSSIHVLRETKWRVITALEYDLMFDVELVDENELELSPRT